MIMELQCLARDKEGYLTDLDSWTDRVAESLAAETSITLTDAHWVIIRLVRRFYAETQVVPAMRPLVKLCRSNIQPAEAVNSIYLMELFGESPAKTIARIAGLPRPTNCL